MKRRMTILVFTLSLLLGIVLWQQQPSVAAKVLSLTASITVNTTADTTDATCADASGNCSLRAANCSWSDFTSFKSVGLSEGRQRSVKDV